MSSHYAKPENALRKAQDFVRAGKESQALKTLAAMLATRRYRTWQPTHEQMMMMYVDLSVDMRKNMKDAFVHYRMICQQTNMNSLEKVLAYYQEKAEQRMKEAEEKIAASADAGELVSVDDDEDEDTPESILRAALSGDTKQQSRADRQVLTPWLKYLWDTYRTILEVLRNNSKLEKMYQETARHAFRFCLKYKRNTSFRRLCEILRTHLVVITKFQGQPNSINLRDPETQKLYLETRFLQLEIAADLELWQEAYRTIEDIYENMQLSTETPEPQLMVTYYKRLAQIFWASENYLFHAYSLEKLYSLTVTAQKNLDAETKQKLASEVIAATLVVPALERGDDDSYFDAMDDGNLRLANLLGFKKEVPTRARLLTFIVQRGVLKDANQHVAQAYNLLEASFSPLSLTQQLKPHLEYMEQDDKLKRYLPAIKQLNVLRVLQQLSRVFKTMKVDRMVRLIPSLPMLEVERIILEGVRCDQLFVRVDHRDQLMHFSDEKLEAERMRTQLSIVSARLQKVAEKIAPVDPEKDKNQRTFVFGAVLEGLNREHKEVTERQATIEKRKQAEEKRLLDSEAKRSAQILADSQRRAREEKQKLFEEAERRKQEAEAAARKAEQDKKKAEMVDRLVAKINEILPEHKREKAILKLKDLVANVSPDDADTWVKLQTDIVNKEKEEKERTHKENARRLDYFVRAVRFEERPLLQESLEKQKIEERDRLQEQYQKLAEQAKQAHARALQEKERLVRITSQKDKFAERVFARRRQIFEEEKAKQEARLEKAQEEKAKSDEKRRREQEERDRELEAQRKIDEEKREEEERRRAEQEAVRNQREAAEKERLRKLAEVAEKQRQREREIEERERAERAARLGPSSSAAPSRFPSREPERARDLDRDRPARDLDRPRDSRPAVGGDQPMSAWARRKLEEQKKREADPAPSSSDAPSRERDEAPRREDAPRRFERDSDPRGPVRSSEDRWRSEREQHGGAGPRPPVSRRPLGDSDRPADRPSLRDSAPRAAPANKWRRDNDAAEQERPASKDNEDDDGFTPVRGSKRS